MSSEPAKVPSATHGQLESNQKGMFLPALILMTAGAFIAVWASFLIWWPLHWLGVL